MIAFSGVIFGEASKTAPEPVSFEWISRAAFSGGMIVGNFFCKLFAKSTIV